MKLKDLKRGMVLDLRNGKQQITVMGVDGDIYYSRDGDQIYFSLIANYNDDLTHKFQKDYDIMKVTFKIPERPKSNLFFEPKKGEDFYYIADYGINGQKNGMRYDDEILKTNIVFKTKEEAEKELLKQQAKIRVIKEIARLNDGWDVREHWENGDVWKYYIVCRYTSSELVATSDVIWKNIDNNLYLKTKELAEQLIETHSDDLKLMLEVE